MTRTLNPQLFGQIDTPVVKVDIEAQTNTRKVREIETQVEILNQKIEKWAQILDAKVQQLQNGQKNLAEQLRNVSDNFSGQQAAIQSKLNERRSAEAKTQELMDRHNQLVQNFNARLSQIQKVASEQEMKLMTYQATYDEILREIRGLKSR